VGNYRELLGRTIGKSSPLNLPRGKKSAKPQKSGFDPWRRAAGYASFSS
jgi:hypothetical protein